MKLPYIQLFIILYYSQGNFWTYAIQIIIQQDNIYIEQKHAFLLILVNMFINKEQLSIRH